MRLQFHLKILLFLLTSCKRPGEKQTVTHVTTKMEHTAKYYCESIKDTFTVFISLPAGYDPGDKIRYPVICLMDANFYFPVFKTIQEEYSKFGLLEPAILIGIGYKDFQTMDSLRDRDYTYPAVSPKEGFSVSGNGDKFLSFLTKDLMRDIETTYPVDTNIRVLMGHSLGGYFTLYALQQHLLNKRGYFSSYISVSPYTHYYTLHILDAIKKLDTAKTSGVKAYVTFGGLEYDEEEDPSLPRAEAALLSLEKSFRDKIKYKGEMYSNFGHMDMALPAFIKGLQWTYYEKH